MRICFINRLMGILRGGGEHFDLNLARALVAKGHDVHIINGRRIRRLDAPVQDLSVTYVPTPYLRGWFYRFDRSDTNRVLRRLGGYALRYDRILFERAAFNLIRNGNCMPSVDVYQLCGLPDLASRLTLELEKKAVVRWPGPPNVDESTKIVVHKYAANFAHGDTMPALLQIDSNAYNIPAGVDISLFHPRSKIALRSKLGVPHDAKLILFVGRLIPIKNLPFLIEAFAVAKQQCVDLKLAIVGEGPERDALEKMAAASGVKHDVVFVGYKEGKKLAEWYSASDIFALVSLYESFSIVVLEAMASGLPVIASRVGYLRTLVLSGHNGILVNEGEVAELADAMLELSMNQQRAEMMGDQGRKWVTSKFTWEKTADGVLSLYQEICGYSNGDKLV